MRNRFLKLLFFFLISKISYADNLDISAKNISIDKKNEITILKDNVIIRDTKGNISHEHRVVRSKRQPNCVAVRAPLNARACRRA